MELGAAQRLLQTCEPVLVAVPAGSNRPRPYNAG